ncbi:MAG: hypothetical protein EON95_01405 [Caulobacteraceae bacterium]|nr:MAG: hypothetical protein EON95_01405 [Caulobacteraceae bacterium]
MRLPRRTLVLIVIAVLAYVGGYVWFRETQSRTWIRDQQKYVIYPVNLPGKALYYAWRPLGLIDRALTGRGSRIGNHLRIQSSEPSIHT